jgi:predicted RNase H-like HicB family nuclease
MNLEDIAFVPALPGCHTQDDTLEEVRKNIKEAIELYLETLTKEEKKELLAQPNFIAMERMKVKA